MIGCCYKDKGGKMILRKGILEDLYYIIHNGRVIFSSPSFGVALKKYRELRAKL